MLTATPVVLPLIVGITLLSSLCNAREQSCSQDGAEQCAMQEHDSDLVSFLQAGSSPHLTILAGASGRKPPANSVARQGKLKAPSMASSPIQENNVSLITLVPTQPSMMISLSELAGHCARFAQRVFHAGPEWVLPVVLVVITLLGVALISRAISHDNRFSDARVPGKQIAQNPSTVPADEASMIAGETRTISLEKWREQQKQLRQHIGPNQSVQQPPSTEHASPPKSPPPSTPGESRLHRSIKGYSPPASGSLILSRPDGSVPPLCPSLVLPTSESRFAINFSDLQAAENNSELKVCGINGKPLLNLKINEDQSGTNVHIRLDVYLARSEDRESRPCCSIIVPQYEKSPFEIRGPGDKHYGTFTSSMKNLNEIFYQNSPIMRIEGNCSSMSFFVTTPMPKCNPVALAAVNNRDYNSEPHFEIRCLPGSDAMLVIAVVMAITLFTMDDESMLVETDQQGGTGSL